MSTSTGLTILNHAGEQSELILGIDLGTTYSLAAYVLDGRPVLVRDASGDARVPSVIAFLSDGTVLVGAAARARAVLDSEHTAYSIKRLIGRTMADLAQDLSYIPYQVIERELESGRRVLLVRIGDVEHTPEELSAMILREVVERAQGQLKRSIAKAVITVPAYFDETQRQATRDAGRLAGLDVVRIVNEPTAAALAYGLQERKVGRIAVYDFGGGTFDCSILELEGGVFRVLATHGDTHLGGDDIDRELMNFMIADMGISLDSLTGEAKQELRDAGERAKVRLSDAVETTLEFNGSNRNYRRTLSRDEFEALIAPLVERTLDSCRAALRDAQRHAADIDEVVMVGGSSRIPLVRQRVKEMFGRPPHIEINPDEVVAAGAAVQGSILAGQMRQILLLDITPLSLGIETMGGAISRLIPRNSTIPVQATERFTTFVDNQTGVELHVVQGERELAADCRSLGRFKLSNVPPMPAGMAQIDVSFLLDANGLLQVTARELRSGAQAGIQIQPSQGLSRDEVERMIKESVAKAKEDFEKRKRIELENKAQTIGRATRKGLESAAASLTGEQRQSIDEALRAVDSAMRVEGIQVLQEAIDQLERVTLPLAELLLNRVAESEVGKRVDDA